MQCIDAKGLFNVKFLQQFMSSVSDSDDIGIIMPTEQTLTKKDKFFEAFWSFPKQDDEAEIILSTQSVYITFTGADFNWWLKTDKRKEKLMSYNSVATVTSRKVLSDVIRQVAVAVEGDNKQPIDIESVTAPESEVVTWLNNTIRRKTILGKYEKTILICLNYHDNEEDKWHTFDEIVNLNMIISK